jgi:valyl-tRNA synthetase
LARGGSRPPGPEEDPARQDPRIEAQFARFQEAVRAVRQVRRRQNVPDRKRVDFAVRCDASTADVLRPMEPYFASLAWARAVDWGPGVKAPALSASVTLPDMEVFVDLADLIDVKAEISRKKKELEKLDKLLAAKKNKLANKDFLARAPEAVVQKERDGLKDLQKQHAAASAALKKMVAVQDQRTADQS